MEILAQLAGGAGIGGVLAGVLYLTTKQKDKNFLDYIKRVDDREAVSAERERQLLEKTLDVIQKNTEAFNKFAVIMERMQTQYESQQINVVSVLERATLELGKSFEREREYKNIKSHENK